MGQRQPLTGTLVRHLLCNSTIVANSSTWGCGIGAGHGDDVGGLSRIDHLMIRDSNVVATASGMDDCGIGTGHGFQGGISRIDHLTICNSTVLAGRSSYDGWWWVSDTQYGNWTNGYASGIGAGRGSTSGSISSIGVILILNSHVEANGSSSGSAIGSGPGFDMGISSIDNLTIWNSTIASVSTYDPEGRGHNSLADGSPHIPAIGAGYAHDGTSIIRSLTIGYSTVNASSFANGCGIGTGYAESGGISSIDNLTIVDSTVAATGLSYCSGIGTGYAHNGTSSILSLTIWHSTVNASTIANGSGIGTGYSESGGRSTIVNLTISKSIVVATSWSRGSGIGTGDVATTGISTIGLLRISNSTVRATGGPGFPGIGSGTTNTEVQTLDLSGVCFIECLGNRTGPTLSASSVSFSAASLVFLTNAARLFERSPSTMSWFDLIIGYRQVTSKASEPLSSLQVPFLHIGELRTPKSNWTSLEWCILTSGIERCFDDKSDGIRSVSVRSHDENHYSFPGWLDGIRGHFASSDGKTGFVIETTGLFIDVLSFVLPPTHCFNTTTILAQDSLQHATMCFDVSPLRLRTEGNEPSMSHHGVPASDSLEPSRGFNLVSFVWGQTFRYRVTPLLGPSSIAEETNDIGLSPHDLDTGRFDGSVWPRQLGKSECCVLTEVLKSSGLFCATGPPNLRPDFQGPPARRNRVMIVD
jgi:hypothetical protein